MVPSLIIEVVSNLPDYNLKKIAFELASELCENGNRICQDKFLWHFSNSNFVGNEAFFYAISNLTSFISTSAGWFLRQKIKSTTASSADSGKMSSAQADKTARLFLSFGKIDEYP